MSILAGATDCSTGLAKAVYDQLVGDTARNGFQGNTPPADWHDMVKAICYSVAKSVADAHNADAPVSKENFTAPMAADQTATSAAWVSLTGQSFTVAANTTYSFEFWIPVANVSPSWQLTGPSSPAAVWAQVEQYNGTAAIYASTAAAFSTLMAPPGSPGNLVRVFGIVRSGANAGTVQLQISNPAGGSAIAKAGGFGRYAKLD